MCRKLDRQTVDCCAKRNLVDVDVDGQVAALGEVEQKGTDAKKKTICPRLAEIFYIYTNKALYSICPTKSSPAHKRKN